MTSNASASTVGSATLSASTSATGIRILREPKEFIQDLSLRLNSTKKLPLHSFVTFFLELLFLGLCIINTCKFFFLWEEHKDEGNGSGVAKVMKYFFILLDPMINEIPQNAYIPIFITTSALFGLFYVVPLILLTMSKSNNDSILSFFNFSFRIIRTILFFPLTHIFLSPLRCSFSADDLFGVQSVTNAGKCYEFPFILFMIVGVFFAICVVIIGCIDSLFLLDKFRSKSFLSSGPDGRIVFIIFITQFLSIVTIDTLLIPQKLDYAVGISLAIFGFLNLTTVFIIIRFLCWFHAFFVFLVTSLILTLSFFQFYGSLVYFTKSYISLISIPSVLFIYPILWGVLGLRYIFLLIFFKKKPRSNILLCSCGSDVAIGIFTRQSFDHFRHRVLNCCGCFGIWKKKKNKVYPSSSNETSRRKMIEVIQSLLEDENFEKTKALCCHLITLVEEEYPQLAMAIINHTKTIMTKSYPDVTFSLEFYKLKISHVQELGHHGSELSGIQRKRRKKALMMSEVHKVKRLQDELRLLICMFFNELDTDTSSGRKISMSNFPRILTTIQEKQEECESIYERLVKRHPSAMVYRSYSKYLEYFRRNHQTAKVYLREARQIDFNRVQDMSDYNTQTGSVANVSEYERKNVFDSLRQLGRRKIENLTNEEEEKEKEEEEEETETDNSSEIYSEESENDDALKEEEEDYSVEQTNEKNSSDDDDDDDKNEEDTKNDKQISKKKFEGEEEEEENEGEEETTDHADADVDVENPQTWKSTAEVIENVMKEELEEHFEKKKERKRHHRKFDESSSSTNHLFKKVTSQKFITTHICLRLLCFTLVFYITATVVSIVVLSFVLKDHFLKTADLIQVSSRAQKAVIESAYFLKKLEISHFSEEETPFDFERNSSIWYDLAMEHCTKLKSRVNIVYRDMSGAQKQAFRKETVSLVMQKIDLEEGLETGFGPGISFKSEKFPLIDGVGAYSDLCVEILKRDNVHWQVNNSDPDYSPVYLEKEFYSIMLSNSALSKSLNNMIHSLLNQEYETSVAYMCTFIILPFLSLFFLCSNCCCCFYFQCLQRRSFRGFLLIPKDQVRKIKEYYSSNDTMKQQKRYPGDNQSDNRTGSTYTGAMIRVNDSGTLGGSEIGLTTNKDDISALNSSSSTMVSRVDISRLSFIQKFFLQICFVTLASFSIFIVFLVVGVMTLDRFNIRNIEYHLVLRIESELYQVNHNLVDYLYPNQSHFDSLHIKEIVEEKLDILLDVYKILRFGEFYEGYYEEKNEDDEDKEQSEHHHAKTMGGNDGGKTPHEVYYDNYCDSEEKEEEFEKLKCLSMNSKIESLRKSVTEILETPITDEYGLRELKSSQQYKIVNMLVNFSNSTIFDEGAINVDYKVLEDYAKELVDKYISSLINLSLLLIILYLPLMFLCMYRYVWPNMSRLNRNLATSKHMMLFMDSKTLNTPNIYDYILTKDGDGLGGLEFSFISGGGSGGGGAGFVKLYNQERRDRMNVYADVLEMSSYGVIAFNRRLDIIHSNNSSEELFRVRSSDATNLVDIFDRDSIIKIRSWMRRRLKNSFSGELCVVYSESKAEKSKKEEYPVHADISRSFLHSDVFVGLFENLESTKKKDLLRNAERRSKGLELLMKHILPSEIVAGSHIQEFLESNECRVYQHKRASAYFGDICNFSSFSRYTSPETVIGILHQLFSRMDDLCQKHGLEKIKTIGDCYFAISGIPTYRPLHAVSAIEFAIDVLRMVREFNQGEYRRIMEDERKKVMEEEGRTSSEGFEEIEIRTGIGSGPVNAAVIGKIKKCYDVWGEMVNEASRMESHGEPGKIVVTRATWESLFGRYEFHEKQVHLQGIGTNVLAYVHSPDLDSKKEEKEEKKGENGVVVVKVKEPEEKRAEGNGVIVVKVEGEEEKEKILIQKVKKNNLFEEVVQIKEKETLESKTATKEDRSEEKEDCDEDCSEEVIVLPPKKMIIDDNIEKN